jgi:hypothetical protein
MTLAEYMAQVKGWNRAQLGGVEPMTRERLDELVEEYGAKSKSIRKKS